MDPLDVPTTVLNIVLAPIVLLLLAKGRCDSLERRFDRLEPRIDGRIDQLETRIGSIDGRIDGLRADLTQVALAVGARPRAENG